MLPAEFARRARKFSPRKPGQVRAAAGAITLCMRRALAGPASALAVNQG
jgi:hypothetical protein